MTTGDFNGDGITDLATANYFDHDVSVLLGLGDGNFATQPKHLAAIHSRDSTLFDETLSTTQIEIVAIAHERQQPGYWADRTPTTWFLRWGLRHTFRVWRRGIALVQFLVVQTLLASFRAVS